MTGCVDLTTVMAGLSAMLTPVIAIITVLILVQQYFLAARTTRLALYEKRYPVFRETLKFISLVCGSGKVSSAQLILFRRYKEENQFLFREDIPAFMKLLYKNGNDLMTTATLLHAEKEDAKLGKYATRQNELLRWFGDQTAVARHLFGQYLRIPRG